MAENKKVMVVTGSSSGVGNVLANHFASKGYDVFGLSRSDKGQNKFQHIPTDITSRESVKSAFETISQQTNRIDVLINNAGVGMLGAIDDAEKSEIEKLFDVNFYGVIWALEEVLPIMRKNNSGHILNVSSIASNNGLPFRGYYSASKSALDRIIEAIRLEYWRTGIEICTLNLGDIQTNIAEGRVKTSVSAFHEKLYQQTIDSIDEEVGHGLLPQELIQPIEKIIQSKKTKPHYYIGKPLQKFSVTLKNILPQKVFEKMMANYCKL